MRNTVAGIALVALPVAASHGALLDFETGFTDRQALTTPIAFGGASMDIWVGDTPDDRRPAYAARVGPETSAFVPVDRSPDGSDWFVTDEPSGPRLSLNYYLSFDQPLEHLGLDLYDYRRDGGGRIRDYVQLAAYGDVGFTELLFTDISFVVGDEPDGNLRHLELSGSGMVAFSLSFHRADGSPGRDVGTGIDNLSFTLDAERIPTAGTPIPLPPPVSLLPLALLGLRARADRQRR